MYALSNVEGYSGRRVCRLRFPVGTCPCILATRLTDSKMTLKFPKTSMAELQALQALGRIYLLFLRKDMYSKEDARSIRRTVEAWIWMFRV